MYRFIKRAFDLLVSAALLIICSPLFAAISLCILVRHGRPVFFLQTRVGRGCSRFRIIKFRTMTVSADTGDVPESAPLEEVRQRRLNFRTTVSGDSRITAVGAFLRRTSLDELPQLLNVLMGHMSLVGPRPVTPMERADYSPEHWVRRHSVRPGITGLAQVSGRSNLTLAQLQSLDGDYVERASLPLDCWILMRTVPALLGDKASN